MPRHQRILSENGTYHVMMRGNERKNLFHDQEDKQRFIETLFAKREEAGFLVYAYCLMDNHVHLLVREASEELATMMKRINGSYAYYFNQKYHRVGHLFQDRFKSEPIGDDRHLLAVIRYIHNNPVKAGLVEKPEQYRWSSYTSYLLPHKLEAKMVETEFILSIFANNQKTAIQEFKRFSSEDDESEFLDLEGSIWTIEEGLSYLDEYLTKQWPGKSLLDLMDNKNTRTELILELKTNTRLSVRTIANLLGINRGIVQKTKESR
ncbi:MAG: transposase [Syntrophomonadaceae bacterium]|nr:transposase [Syntrophomonadaceae bacterium]MDD3897917.1 transposase [Syntrophomonadaceae bacterium]MDD4561769.1 transposase [Syntrophomonadaceae bacterium]